MYAIRSYYDYFELLVKYIEQPELYSKLSNSSRKLYIEKLNWNIWTNELLKALSRITSYNVCYTKLLRKNHGGGLHQGKKNSFLDMHLDFIV